MIGQVFRFEAGRVLAGLAANVVMISQSGGHGSGVLWAPGLVVTNHHVAGESSVSIVTRDGHRLKGEVIAADAEEDLAIVAVDLEKQASAGVADSDRVQTGQLAMAMGHPLGKLYDGSIGIVSGIEQSSWMGKMRRKLLQLDLPLAPGSSGGPIVGEDGRIIGIACMVASPGIGLAVPSNTVERFVRSSIGARRAG